MIWPLASELRLVPVLKLGSECLGCRQSGFRFICGGSVCRCLKDLLQNNHILQHGLQWVLLLTQFLQRTEEPESTSHQGNI